MTTQISLLGKVEQKNILLGGWRWFCAPYDTGVDETVKFPTVTPPAPFRDLGAADNSSSASFTKNMYKYMSGVPKVLKQVKVISMDFTVNLTLDEFSGANLARAIYNSGYAFKKYATSPAIALASAVPVGNVIQVASGPAFIEGQFIGLAAASGGLLTTTDEYKITEISGNFLILDRDVETTFGSAPYIGMIESWKVPLGTAAVNKIALVGCWDEVLEGSQFMIAIPRAVIDGNWSSGGIPATSHQKLQLTVTGQSYYDLDLGEMAVANLLRFVS